MIAGTASRIADIFEEWFTGGLADGFIIPYRCPDEFWYSLLELRHEQVKDGKPGNARMSDVYKAREALE